MDIGDTWNESHCFPDPLTGRSVRRLTSKGRVNQTPTYHTNSGFSADGRWLVFASVREETTWIIAAETETGELTALWRAGGIGDLSYIHRGMSLTFSDVDAEGVCGNRVCIAPQSRAAVFTVGRKIMAVDIETCEPRVLLDDCGDGWIFGAPCVSPDEEQVVIALSSSHPEMRAGKWTLAPEKHYRDYLHKLRLIRVPLAGGGETEVIYEHPEPAQSAHCAFCPTDGDLLYFDLDLPPRYWGGSDGRTPRIWLLDVAHGAVRPLKHQYPGSFQTHQAWLWDGSAMCYHGNLPGGGEYFGLATLDGETLWEQIFPQASFYGHNTPDARRPALIIDGQFSRDKLQWLYYDADRRSDADRGSEADAPEPRLEVICLHSTEWNSLPGQYSHPHPLTDSSGRWISFTSARGGRSDVYVVDVAS